MSLYEMFESLDRASSIARQFDEIQRQSAWYSDDMQRQAVRDLELTRSIGSFEQCEGADRFNRLRDMDSSIAKQMQAVLTTNDAFRNPCSAIEKMVEELSRSEDLWKHLRPATIDFEALHAQAPQISMPPIHIPMPRNFDAPIRERTVAPKPRRPARFVYGNDNVAPPQRKRPARFVNNDDDEYGAP
jgi:hypothetical protein